MDNPNDMPIIEGEDLLRIYNQIECYNEQLLHLVYNTDVFSSKGERIHLSKDKLVQVFPYLDDVAIDKDKWNGFRGAYMGRHYKVLRHISIIIPEDRTSEMYQIWINNRPIRKEIDAHISCMKGLEFLQDTFKK